MRPLKKVFAFSLGIIVFFFVAKVFVAALFLTALLSIPYLFYRGLKSAFREDRYREDYYRYNLPNWQQQDEPLFYGSRKQYDRIPDYRFIDVQ